MKNVFVFLVVFLFPILSGWARNVNGKPVVMEFVSLKRETSTEIPIIPPTEVKESTSLVEPTSEATKIEADKMMVYKKEIIDLQEEMKQIRETIEGVKKEKEEAEKEKVLQEAVVKPFAKKTVTLCNDHLLPVWFQYQSKKYGTTTIMLKPKESFDLTSSDGGDSIEVDIGWKKKLISFQKAPTEEEQIEYHIR